MIADRDLPDDFEAKFGPRCAGCPHGEVHHNGIKYPRGECQIAGCECQQYKKVAA